MVAWGEGDGGGRGDKKQQTNNGGGRLCSRPTVQKATNRARCRDLGSGLRSNLERINQHTCKVGAGNPDSLGLRRVTIHWALGLFQFQN